MRGIHAVLMFACFFGLLAPVRSIQAQNPPEDLKAQEADHAARAAEAASLGAGGTAKDDPAEGLQEVLRVNFPPPVAGDAGFRGFPGSSYVIAYGGDGHLFSLDAAAGKLIRWTTYGNSGFREAIGGDDSRRRIILPGSTSRWDPKPTRILDATDPSNVFEIATGTACGLFAAVIPGAELGVVSGDDCVNLIDLDTGSTLSPLVGQGRRGGRVFGAMHNGEPALLLEDRSFAYDGTRYQFYDVHDPARPVLAYLLDTPRYPWMVFDRNYSILVVASGEETQIRNVADGRILASILPPKAGFRAAIVEGGGVKALALANSETVELFDLANPAAPRSVTTIDVDIVDGYQSLRPHPSEPWLAILTENPAGVTVVDARDGSVILRHDTPDLQVHNVTWTESVDGGPAIALFGYLAGAYRGDHPEGGWTSVETVLLEPNGGENAVTRLTGVSPDRIQAVLPVAGRYAAVIDLNVNAIDLVDGADGTTTDATGYSGNRVSSPYGLIADAAGSSFVVGSIGGLNIFDVERGSLHRRAGLSYLLDCCITDAKVRPDGTVVVLHQKRLETHSPDGDTAALDLPREYSRLRLSPDGTRAALSSGTIWYGPDDPVAMIDLADPSTPAVLWERFDGAHFADFLRGGSITVLTGGQAWYEFAPRLVETETGTPLGDPGAPTPTFFYYAPGAAYGADGKERLVYWHWTWVGWESAVYDMSVDTPVLLNQSEEYFVGSGYAVRSDRKAAYEFRALDTFKVTEAGEFQAYGTTTAVYPDPLRYGFLVGRAAAPYIERREVVFVRDPEMNRAPIAFAGPNRSVECDNATGTPVGLDGSGSSDPDSTPGTRDDIASYGWSVDGAPVGGNETETVSLGLGAHAVELTVTDRLGLEGAAEATVEVADTLPPSVDISMTPVLQPGNLWGGQWRVDAGAIDLCDGELVPRSLVTVPEPALNQEASFLPATGNRIEIHDGRNGVQVVLFGEERSFMEAVWQQARQENGLPLVSENPASFGLSSSPPRSLSRDTAAVYDLDGFGRVVAAAAYGPGADIDLFAIGEDRSGHQSVARTSLQAEIAAYCAGLPENAECPGK